ncbi:MAG: transporter [Conexibacter sp.]|nr:transporter [Conexibacter sp.]
MSTLTPVAGELAGLAEPAAARRVQRWTLAAVCVATAMLMFDITVVYAALPKLTADLGSNLQGLTWVVDAYTVALASVVLSAGSLADRYGRRRVFLGGLGLFTASSVACAAAGSVEVLSVARGVQGAGAAAMFAVSLALLANAFPGTAERAGALAIYGATLGAAIAVGPILGGALTSAFGWQAVFLINAPIGVACLLITYKYVQESRDPEPRRFDVPGQLTLVGGLVLLVTGLLRASERGWSDTTALVALGVAAGLLLAFVAVEARIRAPMLPLGMFRDRAFSGAQVATAAISAGLYALVLYLVLYFQLVLDMTPVQAGLLLVPCMVVNTAVAGATFSLAGRVRPSTLVTAGLLLVAAGSAAMVALCEVDSSWLALQPALCVAFAGAGLFNPAASAMTLAVPERQSGLAAGINDTARQAGMAIGIAALGALIPHGTGLGTGDAQSFVDGLHHAQLAAAALAALGAVAMVGFTRKGRAS